MGQKQGKAIYCDAATPFLNLPFAAIEAMWEAFNDVADGFGVSCGEFQEICAEIMEELKLNRTRMDEKATQVFAAFDGDKNGLVDALEFMAAFAAASGMSHRDTLEFVFNCYDFDGTQELTIDEMTLAMKSTLVGLCKLSGDEIPTEETLEIIAMDAFEKAGKNNLSKIKLVDIIDYCLTNPETNSWVDYYDSPKETGFATTTNLETEIDYADDSVVPDVDRSEVAATENDPFVFPEWDEAFMSEQRPWTTTIESTIPTSYTLPVPDRSAPDSTLQLEWIHGYRAQDVRGNVRYSSRGDVVYHAANVGVAYSINEHAQRFQLDHTGEIVSFALHPDGDIAATGEVAPSPKIVVWDVNTMETLAVIKGFHTRAVCHLAFSNDGSRLASVGKDKEHSLAVYDWENSRLVYSAKSGKQKVLDCKFGEGDGIVTCGINHIYFWSREGRSIHKKSGIMGKRGRLQPFLSLAPCGNCMVSGTGGGQLYVWSKRNCVRVINAHHGSVNALYSCPQGLISGGKDEKVRVWSLSLEAGATFDMSAFGNCSSVRSVCLSADGRKILVGTKGSEIYEISAADGADLQGGPITAGHFSGELHGLAPNPLKPEFITVGDDQTVRVWDVVTRHLVKMTTLDTPARAVAYSPDGETLAVGLGADPKSPHRKDGSFVILNEADLTLQYEARDSKKTITDVRFGPDGESLAIASADNSVYLYDTSEQFEAKGKCKRHSNAITHIDYSEDAKWIQSNCSGNELMFFSAENGQVERSGSAMKDVVWMTQTCTMGWPTQGVWSPFNDGSYVSAVDCAVSGNVQATGDNFGRVRLFKYPAVGRGQLYCEYSGHSRNVTNTCFVNEDSHLITVGGRDRCIFQWKHTDHVDEDEVLPEVIDHDESEGAILDLQDGSDIERSAPQEAANEMLEDSAFVLEEEQVANPENFNAVKPWREGMVEPSNVPLLNPEAPSQTLRLEWVHGYRAQDARNNLRYTAQGHIAYSSACVGVVFNSANNTQTLNIDHSDDVVCLAMNPDGKHIATGQIGRKPKIVIWDAQTGTAISTLHGFHRRAVCQLDFSGDGEFLASVGQDADHSIAVYHWRHGFLKATGKGDVNKVLGVKFSPTGNQIVQVGMKHIKFWEFENRNLKGRRGKLGAQGKVQTFICAEFLGSSPIVGTADGHLYKFEDSVLVQTYKAHESSINALYAFRNGLCSGGKDGMVKLWDTEMTPTFEFSMESLGSCLNPCVRSVCIPLDATKILVGTSGSEIYEISMLGEDLHNGPLVAGHSKYELRGLAAHPTKPEYVTVGDDGTVRVWDAMTCKQLRHIKIDSMARAVAYSPDGNCIAVGLGGTVGRKSGKKDGSFVILLESDLSVAHEGRDSQEWIREVKFCPQGKTLALASQDCQIYMYDVENGFTKRAVFPAHRSFVTHFDFSADGQYMQSNDGAEEMLFADVTTAVQIPSAASLKDTEWGTWTCSLGWPVQSVHPAYNDGSDVNCVDRSRSGAIVATGDSLGRVSLFNYPCVEKGSCGTAFQAAGANVSNVKWLAGDTHLIALGGSDRTVFQWRLDKGEQKDSADEAGDSGEDGDIETDGGQGMGYEFSLEETKQENFKGVKPWVGAMVPPSNLPVERTAEPDIDLELDFVHGYRAEDVRSSLKYNAYGELVYSAASKGIVYDKIKHLQKFHSEHTGDIVSVAVSADGRFAASGSRGVRPRVHVWDATTGAMICQLPLYHKRCIVSVAFSADGQHLASVGSDPDHSICVYRSHSGEWADAIKMATKKGDRRKALFAVFGGPQNFPLVVGGVDHVNFLRSNGRTLGLKQGKIGRRKKIQPMLCGVALTHTEQIITGTATGHIYIWNQAGVCTLAKKAHDKSVSSIAKAGHGFVTGGKDGVVKLWDRDLSVIKQYNMLDALPTPYNTAVSSVCCDLDFSKILVGTKASEIFEITKDSGRMLLLNDGHSFDELWGLAVHPTDPDLYATIGDDAIVRVLSVSRRKILRKARMDTGARAITFSPDGSCVAIGLGGCASGMKKDGTFVVLSTDTLEILHEDRKSKLWISDLKYTPDGKLLCIGSTDGKVYIHNAEREYSLNTVCAPPNAAKNPVKFFDISAEGNQLQVNNAAHELLFFNTDGKPVTSGTAMRDVAWHTQTCTMGWHVQGIWPQENDGIDFESVHRSNDSSLIVSTDTGGKVKVYNYPCQVRGMGCREAQAHSAHATKARFNADDSFLMTIGGYDRSVMQWRINRR